MIEGVGTGLVILIGQIGDRGGGDTPELGRAKRRLHDGFVVECLEEGQAHLRVGEDAHLLVEVEDEPLVWLEDLRGQCGRRGDLGILIRRDREPDVELAGLHPREARVPVGDGQDVDRIEVGNPATGIPTGFLVHRNVLVPTHELDVRVGLPFLELVGARADQRRDGLVPELLDDGARHDGCHVVGIAEISGQQAHGARQLDDHRVRVLGHDILDGRPGALSKRRQLEPPLE